MTMPTTVQQKGRSMGTVTHLPARTPQPAPDESSSLLALMYETGIAVGESRVYERLGIPQPVLAQTRHLTAVLTAPGAVS